MNTDKRWIFPIMCLCFIVFAQFIVPPGSTAEKGPFQATGIKIGEVTDSSAIIWTRLTRNPQRIGPDAPVPEIHYFDYKTGAPVEKAHKWNIQAPMVSFVNGSTIDTIEGAVPGSLGEVRVLYQVSSKKEWLTTEWNAVNPVQDYTRQIKLTNLQPNTIYSIKIESRETLSHDPGQVIEGQFKTAARPDHPATVLFTVSTGQDYNDQDVQTGGYKIYDEILKLKPDFFVHTGDILYYDQFAKSLSLARWDWARMYSLPTNIRFHRQVASYFIKDDHDTWLDDCYPGRKTRFMGEFTFEQGQDVFLEQVPMDTSTYRTIRWGKDVQIWLMEGRDYRSPNKMPDGPEKTIWGKEQKDWFKRTVQESDATFRILISPTPLVGPDRESKHDNHSNADFQQEGDELRAFIAQQKDMYIICGDRHWQYVSVDLKSGAREYSCGPASDEHAGGWDNSDVRPEHKYLNVCGGFLSVAVKQEKHRPSITFRHYGVDGTILHVDQFYVNAKGNQ